MRIKKYYMPYYETLNGLLRKKLYYFDKILLLDIHSFFQNFNSTPHGDIVLSNINHTTSSDETFFRLKNALETEHFCVSDNAIKGGNITAQFGNTFDQRIETIQMEIRYTEYIDKRFFGNEEVKKYNTEIFTNCQERLKRSFSAFFGDTKTE